MEITALHIQNFLSFGKAEFDFEGAGLCLIEGENRDDASATSNGAGKSAVVDALVWCLFGKTLRGYENDEVVNRKVGKDCQVSVFMKGENGAYAINRARLHSKFKNRLSVTNDDGEDISGSSNTETQELVEKILGCTMRTFLSSVVFGQDRAYRFSSLTDKDQKEILDEVLGVERFAVACTAARAKLAEIGASVEDVRHDLKRAEEARDAAEEEASDLRAKDKSFETERAGKLAEQRERLAEANERVKRSASDRAGKLEAAAEKALTKVAVAEEVSAVAGGKATKAREARAGAKSKVDDLQKQVKKHEALAGDCPTCGQRIDELQHESVLGDLKKKLATALKKLEQAEVEVAETASMLAETTRKLTDARGTATSAQKALSDAAVETANLVSWKRRAKDHEERIAELEKDTNPYAALAKKVEGKRDRHQKEVELFNVQLADAEQRAELVDFWVKAFGAKGLRSLLLDTSLPLLNEEAARVSRAVSGGAIAIEFSTTSELKSGKTVDKFEVRVDNKHGAGSYLGNSAGERAKVDLCVGLALQRLVASRSAAAFNVAVFDEIFDNLDEAAHERVVEVLAALDKESVFVISHSGDLKAFFPNVLTIVKRGGFSSVVA